MEDNTMFYLHSQCCNDHWELSYMGLGKYRLSCQKCGKEGCQDIKIEGPWLDAEKCSYDK